MNKNIYKLSLVFLAALSLASCRDNLLEQEPTDALSSGKYWKTEADATSALAGVLSDTRYLFNRDYYLDGMGEYVAHQVIKHMNLKGVMVKDAKILILGITFKENCPDIRNTKVVDIYTTLHEYTDNITVFDPHANVEAVKHEYGVTVVNMLPSDSYDAVILAVAHNEFLEMDMTSLGKANSVLYDVKGILPKEFIDGRL